MVRAGECLEPGAWAPSPAGGRRPPTSALVGGAKAPPLPLPRAPRLPNPNRRLPNAPLRATPNQQPRQPDQSEAAPAPSNAPNQSTQGGPLETHPRPAGGSRRQKPKVTPSPGSRRPRPRLPPASLATWRGAANSRRALQRKYRPASGAVPGSSRSRQAAWCSLCWTLWQPGFCAHTAPSAPWAPATRPRSSCALLRPPAPPPEVRGAGERGGHRRPGQGRGAGLAD